MAKRASTETGAAAEAPKQKMVKVEALKYHTNSGEEYQVGDTYEVEEGAVANLALQGMAARVDRADVAKAERTAAAKRSTAVEPMSTTRGGKALAKPRKARSR